MTEIINGADNAPLTGWVIALVHGRTLIGRPKDRDLDPVYELQALMQFVQPRPDQPPQLMTMRQVLPLLTYASLRRISLPADAVLIQVASLSKQERRELAKSVEACEQMIGAMRAQESGIVLPPPGSRVKQP
jgi:hypothetical protein